jgi:hypothetical protein
MSFKSMVKNCGVFNCFRTYDVWAYEFVHDPSSQIYFYTAIGLVVYFTFSFLSECGIGIACYVSQRMKKKPIL